MKSFKDIKIGENFLAYGRSFKKFDEKSAFRINYKLETLSIVCKSDSQFPVECHYADIPKGEGYYSERVEDHYRVKGTEIEPFPADTDLFFV